MFLISLQDYFNNVHSEKFLIFLTFVKRRLFGVSRFPFPFMAPSWFVPTQASPIVGGSEDVGDISAMTSKAFGLLDYARGS